jgi:hypothetical protein
LYDPGYRDAEQRVAATFNARLEDFRSHKTPAQQLELNGTREGE